MSERGFYMLAGTVLTEHSVEKIRQLLAECQISARIVHDELTIEDQATVLFRPGFDHELILVGDAREQASLMSQVEQISSALRANGIQHAYEIYDTDNQPVHEYEFQP